tara:strand:- start:18 stop:284 length:267 start_codon:yes stop_codon:yes gene_type:complete
MKITNQEYDIIIRALSAYSDIMKYGASKPNHWDIREEADMLRGKLQKEYDEIAERNMAEGMTADEEEIYPSRLYNEYGGSPNGDKKVE